MRYIIDHDLHIHSYLSICSKDEKQNTSAMLEYAHCNNLSTICVTDHYWDSAVPCNTAVNWWYQAQNFEHISKVLPLPQDGKVRFLFGCEVDMDSDNRIGLPSSRFDDFDFIIVATTHFHHMAGGVWEDTGNDAVANRWLRRMYAVFESDLPFHKVGIAHPACYLLNKKSKEDYLETLNIITDKQYEDVFRTAANLGVGIEINSGDFNFDNADENTVLRMFRIAKDCGCNSISAVMLIITANFTTRLCILKEQLIC